MISSSQIFGSLGIHVKTRDSGETVISLFKNQYSQLDFRQFCQGSLVLLHP